MVSFLHSVGHMEKLEAMLSANSSFHRGAFRTTPTEVFTLRRGSIAQSCTDIEQLRLPLVEAMGAELFPKGGVDTKRVHRLVLGTSFHTKVAYV